MQSIKFGKDRYHLNSEMYEWLVERLGPGGWYKGSIDSEHRWAWESAFGNTIYHFRDDRDAIIFLLKWSK